MVDSKIDLDVDYIDSIKDNLNVERGLIKSWEEHHYLDFGKRFKVETLKNSVYLVDTELLTYDESKQLFILIKPVNIDNTDTNYDKDLSELKVEIKNSLIKDWKDCVWIEDSQSSKFAIELYESIHKCENKLREIINLIMMRNFGVNWWEKYTTRKIKDKYKLRFTEHKRIATSFSNVNNKLMSIDTDDLIEIMTQKTHKFQPTIDQKILTLLETVDDSGEVGHVIATYKKFFDKLKGELETEVDLWEELFSKYFEIDFLKEWKDFSKNRNHIAHNKLLDYHAFKIINKNVEQVEHKLLAAEEKIKSFSLSQEEIERLEVMEEIFNLELEEYENNKMEIEANIQILSSDAILDILIDFISEYIEEIMDDFYFREDLIVEAYDFDSQDTTPKNLLEVHSKINGNLLIIETDYEIDDHRGSESKLILRMYSDLGKSELIEECEVSYTNGDAELHEDGQYYIPLVENELHTNESKGFSKALVEYMEESLPYLVHTMDELKVKETAEGGINPVSSSECEECGEEYVCVLEEIAPVGVCVNCGFKNELKECSRCQSLYNRNIEGDSTFCGNCSEYIEEYYD